MAHYPSMSMFVSKADYQAAIEAHEHGATRVLFLDVDGVLSSERTRIAFDGILHLLTPEHVAKLDPVATSMLRALCQHAGIKVVASTSWRITHHWTEMAAALQLPIIDQTPRLAGCRGDEIHHWLQAHPGVEEFAILDDSSDMLDGQLSRFVRVSGFDGLTWANFRQLCEIFSVDPYDCGASRRRDYNETVSWSDV